MAGRPVPDRPATSCPDCLSFGASYGTQSYCRACYDFTRRYRPGECAGCARIISVKKGHCRLCWLQAGLTAAGRRIAPADFRPGRCRQLAFAGMTQLRHPSPRPAVPAPRHPQPSAPTAGTQLQLPIPGQSLPFDKAHWVASAITNRALQPPPQRAHRPAEPHPGPPAPAGVGRALRPPARGHRRRRRRHHRDLVRKPAPADCPRAALAVRALQEDRQDLRRPHPRPRHRPADPESHPAPPTPPDPPPHPPPPHTPPPPPGAPPGRPAAPGARPKATRNRPPRGVDGGTGRRAIPGGTRPLDALPRPLLLGWHEHRRDRWPGTANPHLIINQQTAMTTRPVSENWLTETCRGLTATLERLRVDRQLEEALACGGDPLHLAAMFGIADTTAIRYAAIARQLLEAPAEQHEPELPRTQGPELPTEHEHP